ncbi:MAG TPA: type I 3-dehydroquinate dehydratase [Candidatus Udaeobacter sp.]
MSLTDLDSAIQMRKPPDLFELRLDQLARDLDKVEKKLSKLRAPLIITARHPREGGANQLSTRQRRNLLSRFLPCARYIDVELRSVNALRPLLQAARRKNVGRIVSFHNLKATPDSRILRTKARAAKAHGAIIFKLATRTDKPVQLARLFDFMTKKDVDLAVSVMGIGRLGAISRVLLAHYGSALIYASIGQSRIAGQISLEQLRAFGIGSGARAT